MRDRERYRHERLPQRDRYIERYVREREQRSREPLKERVSPGESVVGREYRRERLLSPGNTTVESLGESGEMSGERVKGEGEGEGESIREKDGVVNVGGIIFC